MFRQQAAALAGVAESGAEGSGVGDAGVDGEGADGFGGGDTLAAKLHRRGGITVAGEDGGDGRAGREDDDGEVVARFGLDGARGSESDSADGEEVCGRVEVDRHCFRAVPGVGFEPTRPRGRGILSPLCLPIPPSGLLRVCRGLGLSEVGCVGGRFVRFGCVRLRTIVDENDEAGVGIEPAYAALQAAA